MTRPMRYLVLATAAAPILAWATYRLARGLGFLDPPWNPEHEQRRTIVAALFAFVLFLSIFLFGYSYAWPRVWAWFGVINGLALLGFGGAGILAARRLWKLRHPKAQASPEPPTATRDVESPAEKPLV